MSRVTRDFLLFARPDQFLPTTVSLEEVADAAVAETETAFPGVSVARRGDFPDVPGSAVLLRRALVNLLRNAIEATPPGRREQPEALLLEGGSAEGEARLNVGDRGEGIDAASREKIFLPFYSSKPGGAGFGLAIVARIAELHGGTVEVTARPGGGSLFTLRLSLGAASPGSAPTVGPKSAEADSGAPDPRAAGARRAPGGPPGKP